MKGHEEFERILAVYRDATPQERASADAHVKVCAECAARLSRFERVDAVLAPLAQPALPAALKRPLRSLLTDAHKPRAAARPSSGALGFVFRGLAPAAAILFIVVVMSAVLWSINSVRTPATMTPIFTTTFTPTTLASQEATRQATTGFQPLPTSLSAGFGVELTPAPVPAPAASSTGRPHNPVLLVGYPAHAKITN